MKDDNEDLIDLNRLYKELGADVLYCMDQVNATDQIYRRALVRSMFAMIEGVLYSVKQVIISAASEREKLLDSKQATLLREEIPELTEAGEIRVKALHTTLKRNLQFTFRAFADIHGITEELDLSGTGWLSLTKSIKVRDRLMHPKGYSDLQISDDELSRAIDGFQWFQYSFERFITAATKANEVELNILKEGGRRAA